MTSRKDGKIQRSKKSSPWALEPGHLRQVQRWSSIFQSGFPTHNPYVAGGMEDLIGAMEEASESERSKHPDSGFSIEHVLADGT